MSCPTCRTARSAVTFAEAELGAVARKAARSTPGRRRDSLVRGVAARKEDLRRAREVLEQHLATCEEVAS